MREVYKGLFVGDDSDFEKVKNDSSWYIVRACKEGPGGHRNILHYTSPGAPKDRNYLFVKRSRFLVLNIIDAQDPTFVPDSLIDESLTFINDQLSKNHKVLIACNHGLSRSPTIAFLYLYSAGKLPQEYHKALRSFRQIYPQYDPSPGLELYAKRRIREMKR
jgi:predicted protein tyrosine phosphatase